MGFRSVMTWPINYHLAERISRNFSRMLAQRVTHLYRRRLELETFCTQLLRRLRSTELCWGQRKPKSVKLRIQLGTFAFASTSMGSPHTLRSSPPVKQIVVKGFLNDCKSYLYVQTVLLCAHMFNMLSVLDRSRPGLISCVIIPPVPDSIPMSSI